MRRKVLGGMALVLMAACFSPFAASASPQEEKPGKLATASEEKQAPAVYRVEYTVRELEEGKRLNARSYKVLVRLQDWSRIRVGSRIPYATGYSGESSTSGTTTRPTQIQYQDVGINIDCRVKEQDDSGVVLETNFESSNLSQEGRNVGGVVNPIFRQVRAQAVAVVPLGKPTVIDVVDDVVSTHQYEIEVTVTQVK